jgi:signal transduction histidine kinase
MGVDLHLAEQIEVPGEVTENVLRIVREAMTNAATHGGSTHVSVRLVRAERAERDEWAEGADRADPAGEGERVLLVIEDDGCGFDPHADSKEQGFGLLSMRERAASIGADLQITSAPDRGTRVTVAFG